MVQFFSVKVCDALGADVHKVCRCEDIEIYQV